MAALPMKPVEMMRHILVSSYIQSALTSLLCLSLLGAITSSSAAANEASAEDKYPFILTQMMLDDLQAINHVPGMAFAMQFGDGRQYCVVTGHANLDENEPVSCRTQFRLASVSKLFAATAAAKLVSEGVLNLDTPVNQYVSYFDLGQEVKVSHLLSHTSGLPHYRAPDGGRGAAHYDSVEAGWKAYGERRLSFVPGTNYQYSTMGYTLLSAVIEEAAKTNYLTYLRDRVFAPLIPHNIAAENPTNPHPNMSINYAVEGSLVTQAAYHDYSYSWGGAGMRSNAPDLARFGALYFHDKFLDQHTKVSFFTPTHLENGDTVGRYYYRTGLGWRIGQDFKGRKIVHHSGVATGARSTLVLYPDSKLSISFLSNARWSSQIERTAYTLALPFQTTRYVNKKSNCPETESKYTGEFDSEVIKGHLYINFEDGICSGLILVDNILGSRLWRNNTEGVKKLRFYFIEKDGKSSTVAMISPYGLSVAAFSLNNGQCSFSGYFGNDQQYRLALDTC